MCEQIVVEIIQKNWALCAVFSGDGMVARGNRQGSIQKAEEEKRYLRLGYNLISMAQVLLLQYRDDVSAEHEVKCFVAKSGLPSTQFKVMNAIRDDFSKELSEILNDVGHVILGGSGQYDLTKNPAPIAVAIKKTLPILNYLYESDFPTLGVCFGCQLIAQTLGGLVEANPDMAETGSYEVDLTPAAATDPIFSQLSSPLRVSLGHKESVTRLPEWAVLLAKSERCPTQAFRYKSNIYAVQFHPELEKEDVRYRLSLYPEYLSEGSLGKVLDTYSNSIDGQKLLQLFVGTYLS